MSIDSAFRTELVKDATIADITSDLTYAVVTGASSTTYQSFTASSNSNSSLSFSVQLPSESIVMGRDILLETDLNITLRITGVPDDGVAFKYGLESAFSPFPFSQLIGTASAQINNTSVSINLVDVLPQLLAMNDRAYLTDFNATTPSLPDGDFGTYSDGVGATNNPLGQYQSASHDNHLLPRGSFPVVQSVRRYIANGTFQDTSLVSQATTNYWDVALKIHVTEPIFISPFTWSDPTRCAMGLVGINNFTLTLNINTPSNIAIASKVGGNPNIATTRCFGSSSPYIAGIRAGLHNETALFTAPRLLLKFLSTQPSDIIEPRNVVPYTDYPRYITPFSNTSVIASKATGTLTTANIQLNQLPSKFMICVRLPVAEQSINNPSTFLAIRSVSLNLNNASGLLSSAQTVDLWKISKKNGSNQTFAQFSGEAKSLDVATGELSTFPTGGSLLVLDPAINLSLPISLANGSLGQYNFQANITVYNQYDYAIQPEIVIVCVNDGICVTNQGTSSTYTGILTRQMVMEAQTMKAIPYTEEVRMTGGRMGNSSLVRHGYDRINKFIAKHMDKIGPLMPVMQKHRLADILK